MEDTLQKIEKAGEVVLELCSGKRKWLMSIPADPKRDCDLIISDALRAAKDELRQDKYPFGQTRAQWRQVLAAVAMGHIIHNPASVTEFRSEVAKGCVAKHAFGFADAFLKQSEKGE